MTEIDVKHENGIDLLQIIPQGVCSKLMQVKIKDDIVLDAEFIGGCAGNLTGIKMLINGLNIYEIIKRLSNIPCGGKETSCPDQLAKGLAAYIEQKQAVKA